MSTAPPSGPQTGRDELNADRLAADRSTQGRLLEGGQPTELGAADEKRRPGTEVGDAQPVQRLAQQNGRQVGTLREAQDHVEWPLAADVLLHVRERLRNHLVVSVLRTSHGAIHESSTAPAAAVCSLVRPAYPVLQVTRALDVVRRSEMHVAPVHCVREGPEQGPVAGRPLQNVLPVQEAQLQQG
eukprot:scaffold1202_cov384-Prasinococcus_capsulatus_cf.AAC.18